MNIHAIEKGTYSRLYLFISFIPFIFEVGEKALLAGVMGLILSLSRSEIQTQYQAAEWVS